ncbi:TIGR03752 family integrating conjugative element protein [Salmonella enterica]|nr:TIGR03752 family integrating conjugative element protein [Salmonella enterica]EJU7780463.1 TIGR03752 family integrating conjugative element protein [Salmonella enterica subsp. arizonae serovar 56:z36:-]EBM5602558.1 TIGR03752 family integrating conjugative element protein [Salmonella enterica]EBN1283391.1 TIGR03752 family integrating conjugative element protein [Salmonella enterica]EBR6996362.1 TIGR03752 family integrating conjugative element protein [Salmonella enterica]
MKFQANILLRILTPLILLAGSVMLFHACQDRKTTHAKPSDPGTTLSKDELKALGIEGDTPADTVATLVGQMKLWRKELATVKASNTALLKENQRLREREHDTDSRINEAINRQQTNASHQQNEILSTLQAQIRQLKERRTTDESLAGLGIEEPEAISGEQLRWIVPADALPTDKNGRPLQPALAFPSTMQNTTPPPETPPPAVVKPVYTLPQNSTLIGSVAMTALLGRIPLNGSATGDWTLSCVRGSLTSITFVFRDGTVRTLPAEGDKTGNGAEGNIGWLSDPHGLPCIPGERKSNAAEYIGSQFLLAGSSAAAQALANNQTTSTVEDGSVTTALTGDSGQYVLGQALGGGLKESADWFKQRYGQMFDAIYVPPGQAVAIHITRQLAIDYDPDGRRVNYHTAGDRTGGLD